MSNEAEEKAIRDIKGFIYAYEDPSAVFGSATIVLCAIRDTIDKLNLPSSKEIGNKTVLELLDL